MATDEELAHAICMIVKSGPVGLPISFLNHSVDSAAVVIGSVVEECWSEGVGLESICIDPELAQLLGFTLGSRISHGGSPPVIFEEGLGRQVRFNRLAETGT